MKRIVSTVIVAITALVLSATLVLAVDPVPNDQGVRISAIARSVDFVSGWAHGKAVSAAASLHGKAVSAAARLKQHSSNAGGNGKGKGQGAAAGANDSSAEEGDSEGTGAKGPKNKETGRLKGAAAAAAGKAKGSTNSQAGQPHGPSAIESPSESPGS
ncbi:MAG TPA: hypothetical protein VEX41_06610 [Candidatus Eisenbacteria bacterium]|nr:hypothetical protein [Candidatus Eisenbacteria bacterium]